MIDNIKPILENLNKNSGIRGSIIMTKDGIIITSDFEKDYNEDLFAAISSSISLTLNSSLKEADTTFSRYVITTDNGKLLLLDIGKTILIILTENDINLAQLNLAIFQAAAMIKKSGRIEI